MDEAMRTQSTMPPCTQRCSNGSMRCCQDPTATPHEFRIYIDRNAERYAVVSEDDWHHFKQWQWSWKKSRRSRKLYARRTQGRAGASSTVYLHIEAMKRKGDVPPSELHTIVGHWDGDSLNCLPENLIWETPSSNYVSVVSRGRRGRFAPPVQSLDDV